MVKPSSFGFLDVSTGAAAAGRSATAVAAWTEDVDMQTVLCAPTGKAVLAIKLSSRPSAESRCVHAWVTRGWRLRHEHPINA